MTKIEKKQDGEAGHGHSLTALVLATTLILYGTALFCQRDTAPPGLNNDAAEEALRGLILLDEGRFEPITLILGNSAETMYLYMVASISLLLGPGTLALQLASWITGVTCIVLLFYLLKRLVPELHSVPAVLLVASSVWMFHYARSGLRTITSAMFATAFMLALDYMERSPGAIRRATGAGCVLGLSLYAYTSCRVLPIAFAIYAVVRLLGKEYRLRRLRSYAAVAAGTLAVSIPNLIFLVQHPSEFLSRGAYVLTGGPVDTARNLLWSLLLPFHYSSYFRNLAEEGFFFDGVSAGLAATGINPVHPIVSLGCLLGIFACWRRRKEPWVLYLALLWVCGTLLLGIAGPSLTRFLILLPAYLVVAAAGFSDLAQSRKHLRLLLPALLIVVSFHHGWTYFERVAKTDLVYIYFSPRTTPLAERARELAEDGTLVTCVISRHAGVVRYLTFQHRDKIELLEFYGRPPDYGKIFSPRCPSDVVLFESVPAWDDITTVLPDGWAVIAAHSGFVEIGSRD